jgi:hypothetical protein
MSDTPKNHHDYPQELDSNPDAYRVGRGKPPLETRWRQGQSGNSSGKRKHQPTYGDLLDRILNEMVSGQENGRKISMTRRKAWVKSLVNGAIAGDPVAEQILLMFEKPETSAPTASMEWRLVDSEDDIPPQ